MKRSFLQKFWKHKIFVSIAFSETGASRGFYLRVSFCFLVISFMLGSSLFLYKAYDTRMQIAMEKSGEVPAYMQAKIQRLNEEKRSQENKIHMFAQELGIIQARLDRFDAIGDKLFNDPSIGGHLESDDNHIHEEDIDGKGDVETPALDTTPTLESLNDQLGSLVDRTDGMDSMMNASMKLLATQEIEKSQKPYLWPLMHPKSYTSSSFGYRKDPFGGRRRFHGGLDFVAPRGAPIVSTGDGIVVFAGYRYGYGITVEIRHAHGFTSRYAHMQETTVKNGKSVKAGDMIGKLGSTGRSTGPHLHLEILVDDTKVDPYPFIKESKKYAHNRSRAIFYKNQLNKKQFVN
ncbi:MAG: murein DD-endopeptidase MepM/ murein hydrolase activator NlpD [Alphaproteobacteria bacterium]